MPEQSSLFEPKRHLVTPVAHARRTDPQTSHAAAASVRHISELKLEILKAYKARGPMRDDELIHYLTTDPKGPQFAASPSGIRSRRAELVVDTLVTTMMARGEPYKSRMATGRLAQVWIAK